MSHWQRFLIIDVKCAPRDMPSVQSCGQRIATGSAGAGVVGLVPSSPMTWLDALADKALDCDLPTREEALAVLRSSDDELMDLVAAAFRVRRRFFGRRVKLNYLVNIKSGLCPEDCFYCSQRVGSAADVLKYSWLKTDEVIATAEAGVAGGARRVCLVASGRGPTDRDIDRVASTIASFKSRNPEVEVCACLGLLSDGQAERLASAGTTAYNHNLNTSGGHYADICTTHEYADRVSTVDAAKSAGLSPCSGLIAGMGETDEDLVDVAFALRALSPDSVPVNFLIPFDGTPLAGQWELTPQRCLRILAMVRFVCPSAEVRLAGGREIHLRTLQPLALHIVNSIFLGDYLTSEGQPGAADLAMIADAGFTVEGAGNPPSVSSPPAVTASAPALATSAALATPTPVTGSGVAEPLAPDTPRPDLVHVRRRGAGTTLPANT
jgi:biotin synthase